VPAAAVIPAPIVYIKVVAVKKLVVGSLVLLAGLPQGCTGQRTRTASVLFVLFIGCMQWLARLL
jgi:hypothetical protein